MPNWCQNELRVSGKRDDLDRFKEAAKGENGCLDMNSFIPYPVEYRNQDEICRVFREEIEEHNRKIMEKMKQMSQEEKEQLWKDNNESWGIKGPDGYNCGGYEWCCDNWGTKWNFCDPCLVVEDLDEEDGYLFYEFATAWSPPVPVIKKMGEKFPQLIFELRYFEGSMQFNGILRIENGEIVDEDCAAYYGHRGG